MYAVSRAAGAKSAIYKFLVLYTIKYPFFAVLANIPQQLFVAFTLV